VLGDPVDYIDHYGLQGFDPATGIPTNIMQPIYNWFNNTFGPKPPSPFEKGAVNIINGLQRDIPKAYNNAHPAVRMCLDVGLTITEWGSTAGLPKWIQIPFDIYSGANFPTLPTSVPGWISNQATTPLY
jgi:hypothetical protein